MLEHKIDFMVTLEVKEANANGDPLNGNMPRTDAKGYGVMSDVSIKRKIRNRLQDMGKSISNNWFGLSRATNCLLNPRQYG